MISKSTKTKRRHNRELLKKIQTINVRCIDKRVDFWLISYPFSKGKCWHTEVRGKQNIRKVYNQVLDHLRQRNPFSFIEVTYHL